MTDSGDGVIVQNEYEGRQKQVYVGLQYKREVLRR